MPPAKSRKTFPSTSTTVAPWARSTKTGWAVATPGATARRRRSASALLFGPGMGPVIFTTPMIAPSVPPDRRVRQVDVDLLGLEVALEAVGPELAAEPRLLVATPRRLVVGGVVGVEP